MAKSTEEILAGLAAIVADEADLPAESVLAEKSFSEELLIDSMTMMTIVARAEDEFDVTIPDDEVDKLVTVGDAVTFIAGALA